MLTGVFIYMLIDLNSDLRLSLKINTTQLRSFSRSLVSIHKSLVTSAVPSDYVVGAVALNCGPFGSVVAYAVA